MVELLHALFIYTNVPPHPHPHPHPSSSFWKTSLPSSWEFPLRPQVPLAFPCHRHTKSRSTQSYAYQHHQHKCSSRQTATQPDVMPSVARPQSTGLAVFQSSNGVCSEETNGPRSSVLPSLDIDPAPDNQTNLQLPMHVARSTAYQDLGKTF